VHGLIQTKPIHSVLRCKTGGQIKAPPLLSPMLLLLRIISRLNSHHLVVLRPATPPHKHTAACQAITAGSAVQVVVHYNQCTVHTLQTVIYYGAAQGSDARSYGAVSGYKWSGCTHRTPQCRDKSTASTHGRERASIHAVRQRRRPVQ